MYSTIPELLLSVAYELIPRYLKRRLIPGNVDRTQEPLLHLMQPLLVMLPADLKPSWFHVSFFSEPAVPKMVSCYAWQDVLPRAALPLLAPAEARPVNGAISTGLATL